MITFNSMDNKYVNLELYRQQKRWTALYYVDNCTKHHLYYLSYKVIYTYQANSKYVYMPIRIFM